MTMGSLIILAAAIASGFFGAWALVEWLTRRIDRETLSRLRRHQTELQELLSTASASHRSVRHLRAALADAKRHELELELVAGRGRT